MSERSVVVVAHTRSAIGRAGRGRLKDVRADDLCATVVASALASVPQLTGADIDELVVGCGQPAGEQGYGIGRVVAVLLGLETLPAATVQRYCVSSLSAVRSGYHAILAGEADVVVAAGVESISRYSAGKSDGMPDTKNPRFAEDRSNGLPDVYMPMGLTAENVAVQRRISREAQDAYALRSQRLTADAQASGFWADEITPVMVDGAVVDRDESPRPQTTAESLALLEPAFSVEGTVTAGNCCPLNDGAAAVILMDSAVAEARGIRPLARIIATGVSALSPEIMGLAPVEASRRALAHAGMSVGDVDIFEINEAFAAQVIPSCEDLGVDPERVNPYGGAIALGHPFGMTGARMLGTLVHGLRHSDKTIGMASLCAAGGQGMSVIVERS